MAIERYHLQLTSNGASKVSRDLTKVGVAGKGATSAMGGMKTAMIALAGAYVGLQGLKQTISVIRDFDTTMLEVKAVTNATAQEFDMLSEAARNMGATTRFSASESGQAILALSRAGFTTAESMAALGDTLNLAIAGVIGIQEASDLAAITIRQFGLEATETNRVADTLVTTANNSAQTVGDLAESMKYAGAVAGSMNVSLEETAGTLGVLANAGIRGSMAGTTMRKVLLSLSAPTSSANKALERLGLTFEDISLKNNTVAQAFKNLNDAGMDAAAAQQIFSTRALSGALALAKNNEKIEEFVKLNKEAEGAAKAAAETMDSGLNAAFLRLKSVSEELMLKLGDAGLTQILKDLTSAMASALSGDNWIGDLFAKLGMLGDMVGKFVFLYVDSMNEVLNATGKVVFGIVNTYDSGLTAIAKSWDSTFRGLGKDLFDFFDENYQKKGSDFFKGMSKGADEFASAYKKTMSDWEDIIDSSKGNIDNIIETYNSIDWLEAYRKNLAELKKENEKLIDESKDTAKEIATINKSFFTGFGITDTTAVSTESLIPQEVLDNTTESIKTFAQENKDIMDVSSSNISKSLGDMFTGVEGSFASFMNSITAQIIRMMTNKMVTNFFSMLSGLGGGAESNIADIGGFGASGGGLLGIGSGSGGFANAFALGGEYSAGVPRMTGEYGTEIDVPSVNGRVLSRNDAMNAVNGGGQQPVNKFIFLSDPNELTQELQSTENERIIVQTMHRYGRG